MDLLRHWRRRTFGAAAGVVIAPAAIVLAALAVGFGGGGVGSLGSLGQILSGPELPAVSPLSGRKPADEAGKLLAGVEPRRRGSAPGRGRSDAPSTNGGTGATSAPTQQVASAPRRTPPQQTASSRPAGGTPPVARAPAPPVAAAPPAPPSPARQVGDDVKQITDPVPVAGQPVGNVVDLLVDTVDGVAP